MHFPHCIEVFKTPNVHHMTSPITSPSSTHRKQSWLHHRPTEDRAARLTCSRRMRIIREQESQENASRNTCTQSSKAYVVSMIMSHFPETMWDTGLARSATSVSRAPLRYSKIHTRKYSRAQTACSPLPMRLPCGFFLTANGNLPDDKPAQFSPAVRWRTNGKLVKNNRLIGSAQLATR